MTDQTPGMAEVLVRSVHPEKVFDYLPGMNPANLAALYGLDEPAYRALRDRYADQARDAAHAVLAAPEASLALERLPFRPGDTLAVVGESTTDAADSWLEILGHVLAEGPGPALRLVNAAIAGYPTTMVQRVLSTLLARDHPDWVVIFAGGNDVLRYGAGATKPLVHPTETGRNLAEMRRAAVDARARVIWVTPTSMDVDKARNYPPFQAQHIWVHPPDVAMVVQAVRAQAGRDELLVDLAAVLGQPPRSDLVQADGIHPTLAGHTAIVRAFITQLADQVRRP
ncbi:MAG TPA: SGNH/GDSL hydrolase family protein, partial [Acidimicrobiales bacterium]|nr:SGNH/GDSL hydrolase family protein [Acidimicrobiales bacterium]